jgi:hypothetical protein
MRRKAMRNVEPTISRNGRACHICRYSTLRFLCRCCLRSQSLSAGGYPGSFGEGRSLVARPDDEGISPFIVRDGNAQMLCERHVTCCDYLNGLYCDLLDSQVRGRIGNS